MERLIETEPLVEALLDLVRQRPCLRGRFHGLPGAACIRTNVISVAVISTGTIQASRRIR